MKVWAIEAGCVYEGGDTVALYSTPQRAREAAIAEVEWRAKEEREEHERFKKAIPGYVEAESRPEEWLECTPGRWTNQSSYITICEWEVDAEIPKPVPADCPSSFILRGNHGQNSG